MERVPACKCWLSAPVVFLDNLVPPRLALVSPSVFPYTFL